MNPANKAKPSNLQWTPSPQISAFRGHFVQFSVGAIGTVFPPSPNEIGLCKLRAWDMEQADAVGK